MIYDLVLDFNHNYNLGITYKDYCILQDLVVAFIPKLSLHPFVDASKVFKLRQTPHCINILNSTYLNLNSASKAERRRCISICSGRMENQDCDENDERERLPTSFPEKNNSNSSPKSYIQFDMKSDKENEPLMTLVGKESATNNNNQTLIEILLIYDKL